MPLRVWIEEMISNSCPQSLAATPPNDLVDQNAVG